MHAVMIQNYTRTGVGKSQGYKGLTIRDTELDGTPVMITAWSPTPSELEYLNAGANVELQLFGSVPPPQFVGVGPLPDTPIQSTLARDTIKRLIELIKQGGMSDHWTIEQRNEFLTIVTQHELGLL